MDNEKVKPDEAVKACEEAQVQELTNVELDQVTGGATHSDFVVCPERHAAEEHRA